MIELVGIVEQGEFSIYEFTGFSGYNLEQARGYIQDSNGNKGASYIREENGNLFVELWEGDDWITSTLVLPHISSPKYSLVTFDKNGVIIEDIEKDAYTINVPRTPENDFINFVKLDSNGQQIDSIYPLLFSFPFEDKFVLVDVEDKVSQIFYIDQFKNEKYFLSRASLTFEIVETIKAKIIAFQTAGEFSNYEGTQIAELRFPGTSTVKWIYSLTFGSPYGKKISGKTYLIYYFEGDIEERQALLVFKSVRLDDGSYLREYITLEKVDTYNTPYGQSSYRQTSGIPPVLEEEEEEEVAWPVENEIKYTNVVYDNFSNTATIKIAFTKVLEGDFKYFPALSRYVGARLTPLSVIFSKGGKQVEIKISPVPRGEFFVESIEDDFLRTYKITEEDDFNCHLQISQGKIIVFAEAMKGSSTESPPSYPVLNTTEFLFLKRVLEDGSVEDTPSLVFETGLFQWVNLGGAGSIYDDPRYMSAKEFRKFAMLKEVPNFAYYEVDIPGIKFEYPYESAFKTSFNRIPFALDDSANGFTTAEVYYPREGE